MVNIIELYGKKDKKLPSALLGTIIDDLNLYNGLYFQLKMGLKGLLEQTNSENGSLEKVKRVAEIYRLEEILNNLESIE